MTATGYYLLIYKCDACGREAMCRDGGLQMATIRMRKEHPGWGNRGHHGKCYCPDCAPGIPKFRMELGKVDGYGRLLESKKKGRMKLV